jgi:hypothetical protein
VRLASTFMTLPAAALAIWAATAPASAAGFSDAPIACGAGSPYKECKASFDGWSLRIAHVLPGGRGPTAVYRKCVVEGDMLHCADGEWRSGDLSGPLPGRSIGLRSGRPFPD